MKKWLYCTVPSSIFINFLIVLYRCSLFTVYNIKGYMYCEYFHTLKKFPTWISCPSIRELEEMSKGENIVKWIKGQRISWLGHLERMEEDRMPKKIFTQELEGTNKLVNQFLYKTVWNSEVINFVFPVYATITNRFQNDLWKFP